MSPEDIDFGRKTVCVNFGLLHSYRSGWTGHVPEDSPEPGARKFVA